MLGPGGRGHRSASQLRAHSLHLMNIFLSRVVPAKISPPREHLHFNLTFFSPRPDSWVGLTVLGDKTRASHPCTRLSPLAPVAGLEQPCAGDSFFKETATDNAEKSQGSNFDPIRVQNNWKTFLTGLKIYTVQALLTSPNLSSSSPLSHSHTDYTDTFSEHAAPGPLHVLLPPSELASPKLSC